MCQTCFGAVVYPEFNVTDTPQRQITERINIVFDNSGHQYVNDMFMDVITAVAFAENSDIWLYPIAGGAQPVKLEASKSFIEKNFVAYTKSSNEYKAENVVEKALADLYADNTVEKKHLIMYCHHESANIRSEYDTYEIKTLLEANPSITFTAAQSVLGCIDEYITWDDNNQPYANYYGLSDKLIHELLLIKYGYSECVNTYNDEYGYLKIDKGQADKNIFVVAGASNSSLEATSKKPSSVLYLGGCLADTEAFEKYATKDKVKGVALAYNYIATDGAYGDESFAAALFTLDGTVIDPATEDLYIPVINAQNHSVKVYYRSTPGMGLCSDDTEYNAKQDKEIINLKAKTTDAGLDSVLKDENSVSNKDNNIKINSDSVSQSIAKSIVTAILSFIGGILGLLLCLLYFGAIACGIGLIVSPKFRGYVHLKVSGTKLETLYDYITNKISKFKNEMTEAGIKIKGNANIEDDFLFISKSSKDMGDENGKIALVIKELEKRGVKCWLSEKGIGIGANFNEVITERAEKCTAVLFFASINSLQSAQVESELGIAKFHQKIIIPIQIEKFDMFGQFPKWLCILNQYQKKDLFSKNPESIKAIVDEVEEMYNKLKRNK